MIAVCDIELKVTIHQEVDTDDYPGILDRMITDNEQIKQRVSTMVEDVLSDKMVDDLSRNSVYVEPTNLKVSEKTRCGTCLYYVHTDDPDSVLGYCTCPNSKYCDQQVLEYMDGRCKEHKKA